MEEQQSNTKQEIIKFQQFPYIKTLGLMKAKGKQFWKFWIYYWAQVEQHSLTNLILEIAGLTYFLMFTLCVSKLKYSHA